MSNDDGTEYWYARELAFVLDYNKWGNFHKVIKRAMIACENSGHDITRDFPEVRTLIIHCSPDLTQVKIISNYGDKTLDGGYTNG